MSATLSNPTDITARVVDTIMTLTPFDLPDAALAVAKDAILDVLACAVAGSTDESARLVASWVQASGGAPTATIVGSAIRSSPALAALASATAAHALDYDDVSSTMVHPSTTVLPALLALAERHGLSGSDLLAAYVVGFEVQTRICRAINPTHYARGWHTTKSVGVLGVAAAAARLLGLDREQTATALGIAAASASGIRRNFGTMVKPLHAGHAALHGVEAAELAATGFSADLAVLDGESGYFALYASEEARDRAYEAFAPDAPIELVESGVWLKRHACCGAIHSGIDAAEQLMIRHGLQPSDIAGVECRVNAMVPNILVHHAPASPLEGKFSAEYSIAVMLVAGRAGLAQFSDEQLRDAETERLTRACRIVVDPSLPVDLALFPNVVTLELAGGGTVAQRNDIPRGHPDLPMSTTELEAKVLDCCTVTLGVDGARMLIDGVRSLEDIDDVSQITCLLVPDEER